MSAQLLLTFDARHVAGWEAAVPLSDVIGARVTFFVVEADLLDDQEQAGVRRILSAGHYVGSHGARHRNADQTLAEVGAAEYLPTEIVSSVKALPALGASANSLACHRRPPQPGEATGAASPASSPTGSRPC